MYRTPVLSAHVRRVTHVLDASEYRLGHLASAISRLLQGKHKPSYDPARDHGDKVLVVNARHVQVSADKRRSKLYRHHTGHPGGLKEEPMWRMLEKKPCDVVKKAVSGMLPKNKLRRARLAHLAVYPNDTVAKGHVPVLRAGGYVQKKGALNRATKKGSVDETLVYPGLDEEGLTPELRALLEKYDLVQKPVKKDDAMTEAEMAGAVEVRTTNPKPTGE